MVIKIMMLIVMMVSEVQPGTPLTSELERFATAVNGGKLLTIAAKLSVLDVYRDPKVSLN